MPRRGRRPSSRCWATQQTHAGTVDRIKDPKDLKAMALMLRPLNNYADDFDVGFWLCVDLLAEDTSDRAVAALRELNLEIRPESGDKQQFDEAIEHQRKKRLLENSFT